MNSKGSSSSLYNTGQNTTNTDKNNVSAFGGNNIEGLKLRNDSKIECYLNTAINTIVTNEILMKQLVRGDPLKRWGEKMLLKHVPNFSANRESTNKRRGL